MVTTRKNADSGNRGDPPKKQKGDPEDRKGKGRGSAGPKKGPKPPLEGKKTQFQLVSLPDSELLEQLEPVLASLEMDELLAANWAHGCLEPARRLQRFLQTAKEDRDKGCKEAKFPEEVIVALVTKVWGIPIGEIPFSRFQNASFHMHFFEGRKGGSEFNKGCFKPAREEGGQETKAQELFEGLMQSLAPIFQAEKPKSWGTGLVNAVAFEVLRLEGMLTPKEKKEWQGRPNWNGQFVDKINQWLRALPKALKTPIAVPLFHLFKDLGLLADGEYEEGLETVTHEDTDAAASEGVKAATGGTPSDLTEVTQDLKGKGPEIRYGGRGLQIQGAWKKSGTMSPLVEWRRFQQRRRRTRS